MLLGFPIAWVLARATFPGRSLLRALVLLPMVVPPVIGGVALLVAFGRRGLVGQYLDEWFDIQLAYTRTAAVLAATFVSMPFFVITVEAALRGVDRRYEDAARTLGASPGFVLRHVTLPSIRARSAPAPRWPGRGRSGSSAPPSPSPAASPGRPQTMPLAIYDFLDADVHAAILLSLVLLAVSVVGAGAACATAGWARHDRARDRGARAARGALEVDVDLAVAPGETLAVLGPNGAGKTTLLRDAERARCRWTTGTVALDGRVLDDPAAGPSCAPEERSIGVVFQDLLLFPALDVTDNVAFGLRAGGDAPGRGPRAGGRVARAAGPRGPARRPRSAGLSGGEAQRVALARALAAGSAGAAARRAAVGPRRRRAGHGAPRPP